MPALRPLPALCLAVVVGGCSGYSQSGWNPANWFGGSKPTETIVLPSDPVDPRPMVESVLSMTVEPVPGGAIVRARGQTPTQGWWQAELVRLDIEDAGSLVYEFRIQAPLGQTAVNTPQSRQVDVAVFVSDIKLDGVREIVVQGANNARSARR